MHTKNATHAENSIDCVRCFCMHALRFSVFWLRRKPCVGCVACLVYDNLETARRPTKMDLKACFQAGVRNAMDATHAGHATQIKKTATHAMNAHEECNRRIACCMCCVFRVRALRISGFGLRCKPCVRCVLSTTPWKPHVVDLWVGLYSCLHFSDESVDQQSDAM